MKFKLYFFGVAGLLIAACLGIYSFNEYHQPIYQPVNYSLLEHAAGRADYNAMYYRMLRENENGVIDFKEVMRAREGVKNFRAQKNSANSLVWDYMGPDFVGGRCRALLQDNQTKNSSIMYAGGVSGGFFISYDAANSWYDNTGDLPNLAISCITQTTSGAIFIGTGSDHEGLGGAGQNTETGHIGGGLFRRDASGNGYIWKQIIGPASSNTEGIEWTTIQDIQASPVDQNRLYVGARGLWYTNDALASEPTLQKVDANLSGTVDDIVISNDGQYIFFSMGGQIYRILEDGSGPKLNKTIPIPAGNGSSGRIMLAMSPDDNKVLYAAVSKPSTGSWPATGCLYGIFQSRDNGETWVNIGPGGSPLTFEPYGNVGTNCQGDYDNTVSVYPGNPGKIIVGGVQLWQWEESQGTPGVGGWSQIAVTTGGGLIDENYVHADKHRILITTPNTIFIASDGGIGKSVDGGATWTQNNNGFNITQFYTVAAAPAISFEFNGQTFFSEQIIGGTQDNGTQFVGFNTSRPRDPIELKGGDGFDCAFSTLSNLAYATVYNGDLSRHSFGNPQGESFFDPELDTICKDGCGDFFTRMTYWETPYAESTFDSVLVHIKQTINIGDSIHYSGALNVPMSVVSTQILNAGDSLMLPDFSQSRLAFVSGSDGLYMTRDAAKLNTVNFKWDRIADGSALTYPDPLNGSIFTMEFSEDGDHLFVGTAGGNLYRISNLNQGYDSTTLDIRSPGCVLTCTRVASIGGVMTDIAVDPNDANNVVMTMGGYGRTGSQIFRITNAATALTSGGNLQGIQGDLPNMPLYCTVIAAHDKNTVLVGTEFGIYGTDNAFAGVPTWTEARGGMPIVPVYAMKQQSNEYVYSEDYPWSKNVNYKKVYVGTCGRGFYRSTGLVGIEDKESPKIAAADKTELRLKVFPNPVSSIGSLEIFLPETQHTTVQIFDLNGRLVTTVHNASLQGGKQRLEFDANKLNTGTYLASVRTSSGTKVSKFVVMK